MYDAKEANEDNTGELTALELVDLMGNDSCINPNLIFYVSVTIVDPQNVGYIETISVTFEYDRK